MRLVACLLVVLAACSSRRESEPAPAPRTGSSSVTPSPPVPAAPRCEPSGGSICVGEAVVECGADGTRGKTLQTCKDGCRAGACVDTCAMQDVELVYVVDRENNLLRFDPRKLPGDPFHLVGKLRCDPSSSPFSMAVDRRGVAWVLYANGRLFRASIIDARCSPAAYTPSATAATTFGMGFVTDGPTASTEKLFVAANDDTRTLASLNTAQDPVRWSRIGTLAAAQDRNPELTGTGDGKLFGYFPDQPRGFVQELDPTTAKPAGPRMNLAAMPGTVGSYAFAHWGGVFYVFTTIDQKPAVHSIDRATGAYNLVLADQPYNIVGAGVSTCAPLLEAP